MSVLCVYMCGMCEGACPLEASPAASSGDTAVRGCHCRHAAVTTVGTFTPRERLECSKRTVQRLGWLVGMRACLMFCWRHTSSGRPACMTMVQKSGTQYVYWFFLASRLSTYSGHRHKASVQRGRCGWIRRVTLSKACLLKPRGIVFIWCRLTAACRVLKCAAAASA